MQRRLIVCIVLFLSTVLVQKIVLVVAPVDGNFEKHALAARLYSTSQLDPERITDFSPFYFELHLGLLRIFGRYESHLIVLQVIAAGLSVVALYRIAGKYLSQWAAILAAVALIFSTGLVILTQIFVPDLWFLTFLMLALLFLFRYATETESLASVSCSAIFFGLALFTRPTILLYFPFALLFILLQRKNNYGKASLCFLLIFFASFLLFLYRNYSYTAKATLAVMDSGGVFFEGNNPYSDGDGVHAPLVKELEGQYLDQPSYAQKLVKQIPSAVMGRKLYAAAANRYWQNKALHYIAENPMAYFRLLSRKVYRLFRSSELHDVLVAHLIDTKLRARYFPFVPISLVTALALFGLYARRHEWKNLLPLYAGFFLGCGIPLIYFVSSRYRLPLIPFLLFFGCVAVEFCFEQLRSRKFRASVALLVFTISLVAALDWPEEKGKRDSYLWQSIMEAHRLQKYAADLRNEGNRVAAVQNVSASIVAAPFLQESLTLANLPYEKTGPLGRSITLKRAACDNSMSASCLFDLGLLLLESGQVKGAKEIFQYLTQSNEIVHRWSLCSPYPEFYLGRIAAHDGKWSEALQHYHNVLNVSPGEPNTLAGITVALEKTGDITEARRYREKLFRYFDEPDAMMFLGRSYWFAGNYEKSADCFLQVGRWLSDYRKAHIFAAASLGRAGRIEKAVVEYWKGLAIKEEPLLLQEPILEIFRQYALQRNTAPAQYAYGVVLRQSGRFEEAFEIQQGVLKLQPDFAAANSELKGITMILRARAPK